VQKHQNAIKSHVGNSIWKTPTLYQWMTYSIKITLIDVLSLNRIQMKYISWQNLTKSDKY